MVRDGAVERFCRRGEAAGHPLVGFAGRRIAAGMIVSEQDGGASEYCGVPDDRPEREIDPMLAARVPGQVQASRLVVQMRDPERFQRGIRFGKAAGEEIARGRGAVQLQRMFGTLAHARGLAPHNRRGERNRIRLGSE